uniref:Uncharacterized protein n=1 Tax=Bitis gabonica TaxID=8694 RepID=Q6T6T0_BITGA|nr:hypothetical protein 1 [Bitis gabonica]
MYFAIAGYCISHAGFQTNKRVVLLECNKLRVIKNQVVVISLKLRDGNKTYIMFSEGCFAFKQLLFLFYFFKDMIVLCATQLLTL